MTTAPEHIVVTGAAGKAGRAAVAELLEHGYRVTATDLTPEPEGLGTAYLRADLLDHGQVLDVLEGADAVVHLANIPAPGLRPAALTLTTNTTMNAHVFLTARSLGLRKVVWASSETTLGLAFGPDTPPRYAPVDEDHYPHPESTYALSKVMTETMAEHISAWSGIPFVGLRFSNIFTDEDYRRVPSFQADPRERMWNLWGYIDVRDAAASCRNALEADTTGSVNLIIAGDDTIMERLSADLLAEVFPDVEVRGAPEGHETLLSNARAKRVIGFQPRHGWRQGLPA
ncbi:NAD(P)-dependent oxidoreductase [Terrabacter sp. MAHUQ-38]|uniref:NAD-dependent epimerase/dehydratase family protein n=1 Tax=unclassified Terrabacter TaxID=2630222 RepID=UPI00165E37F3|nr:NAD(P)-dependent oxidoreductase [Terrabacter sp. MAHUQ-38]MBC9823656.1 NAD(P)-dependent oxidoreductase [Terrabacter sp. MAHUQ-38]